MLLCCVCVCVVCSCAMGSSQSSPESKEYKEVLVSLRKVEADYQTYGIINGLLSAILVYLSSFLYHYGVLPSTIRDHFPYLWFASSMEGDNAPPSSISLISTCNWCVILSLIVCRVLIALRTGLQDSVSIPPKWLGRYPDHPTYYTYWVAKRTITNCVWCYVICLPLRQQHCEIFCVFLPILMLNYAIPFACFSHSQCIVSKDVRQWRQGVANRWLGNDWKCIPEMKYEDGLVKSDNEDFCMPFALICYLVIMSILWIVRLLILHLTFFHKEKGFVFFSSLLQAIFVIFTEILTSMWWGLTSSMYILVAGVIVYICLFRPSLIDVENMNTSNREKEEAGSPVKR